MFAAVLFAISLHVLVPAAWLAGRGESSARHRLTLGLVLAWLSALPALPTLLLPLTIAPGVAEPIGIDEHGQKWFAADPAPNGEIDAAVVVLTWLALLVQSLRCLRMPRAAGLHDARREVRDAELLQRVQQLASALHVPPPRVFEVGAFYNDLHARTGGLVARVLLLSKGLTTRLPPRQVDAIIAHELAHVANHDALRLLAGYALWFLVVVSCSAFLPLLGTVALLAAARGLLHTVLSHQAELRADRVAGRVVGGATMAAALDKLHHDNLQGESWPVAHAVASHPALAVRVWHLRRVSGNAECVDVDTAHVARCRRARALVLSLWTLAVGVVLAAAATGFTSAALAIGLGLAALPLLHQLKLWRELRTALQFDPGIARRWVLTRWPYFALAVGGSLALVALQHDQPWWWLPMVLALGLWWVHVVWRLRIGPLRRELNELLTRHDFRGYLAACYKLSPHLRAQPEQRVQEGLARAALGDPGAVDALLQIAREHRSASYALRWAVVVMRTHDAPRAVQSARDLVARLPGNAMAEGLLASTLRYAGAFDEAWQRIGPVIERLPRIGGYRAVAGRIALARGDRATAEREVLAAERLAPAEMSTLLARADFDLQTGSANAAAALEQARTAAARSPLEFLMPEVDRLERMLRGRGA